MKTLLLILYFLVGTTHAFEWEASVREMYITRQTYTYNSDSSSRIRRELFDRGYKRMDVEPRIAYMGDERSMFYLPPTKTSFSSLGVMNARVSQANGELTIKPIIYENPDLGEAKPIAKINPKRAELALTSYGQIMTQFTQVARTNDVSRLVVGSGLVHLMKETTLLPKFEILLKGIRKGLTPKTELVLELVGQEDIEALFQAVNQDFPIMNLVDGLSVVADPSKVFPDGSVDIEALKQLRLRLDAFVPGMPIHLSRIVVPGCALPQEISNELYCSGADYDPKLQVSRFIELKKALISLETEGFKFRTVSILEATTDFEPSSPNRRYPFYNSLFNDPAMYELPKQPLILLPSYPTAGIEGLNSACIYYDKNDLPPQVDRIGDIHSVMLQSLIGSFKSWTVRRKRIQDYLPGELSGCQAVFYLATNFAQELPQGFADEVADVSNQIPVVWFNYKFSSLNISLKNKNRDPGFDAAILIQPDSVPTETNTDPGFFRYFDYKGETFLKLAQWNPAGNNFAASPEVHYVNIKEPLQVQTLATSRHSKTNQIIPYAVRSGNIFYMADSPFSFVHYEDRFFILADMMWDIFKEEPPKERIALVRIEDVGPTLDMVALRWAMTYLADENVPVALAVIPIFSDVIGAGGPDFEPVYKPVTKFPNFVAQLKYGLSRGGSAVMHGSVHSVGCLISGYDGISGGDYEFWLYPENRPLPFDSIDWVTRRLELGISVFRDLGIKPVAFEVPHYAASVMNYVVFSKMFKWNYHRTIYFPNAIVEDTALPERLGGFECDPKFCGDERRGILNNLEIKADYTAFGGMILPFIVYKDAYGQSIIPETLGLIDFAFYDPKTWRPVSKPEDILRRAKKLKVIRGAVASFFWHPQLLNPKSRYYQEVPGSYEAIGGEKSLTLVVDGLRKLGYTFKSIEDQDYFPSEASL